MDMNEAVKTWGPVTTVVIAILVGGVWINDKFKDFNTDLLVIRMGMVDQWSATDQEIFALRLQLVNPELEVPDPRLISGRLAQPDARAGKDSGQ